jgi:hypothetical protein
MQFDRVICFSAVALLCSVLSANVHAQSLPSDRAAVAVVPKLAEPSSTQTPTSRDLLLGVDSDGDGIRDDIEAIVAKNRSATAKLTSVGVNDEPATSEKERALASLSEERPVRKDPPRRNCLDYLMLEPRQRYKADLRLRAEANGVLGMHPCDPVVSPLLERPFESDFLQLDLGPVFLRY